MLIILWEQFQYSSVTKLEWSQNHLGVIEEPASPVRGLTTPINVQHKF